MQVAFILTLSGIQAACLNMRHIQMSSTASVLIVNPMQSEFRGHVVLTSGANVISHWSYIH